MPRKVNAHKSERIEIRTRWGSSDHLPTLYANELLITHAGREVYIVFGETIPPLVLKKEDLPAELTIKPVARIAVSRDAMKKFADAIITNLRKLEQKERTEAQ